MCIGKSIVKAMGLKSITMAINLRNKQRAVISGLRENVGISKIPHPEAEKRTFHSNKRNFLKERPKHVSHEMGIFLAIYRKQK